MTSSYKKVSYFEHFISESIISSSIHLNLFITRISDQKMKNEQSHHPCKPPISGALWDLLAVFKIHSMIAKGNISFPE